jgi:hypothetical protein
MADVVFGNLYSARRTGLDPRTSRQYVESTSDEPRPRAPWCN